MAAQKGKALLLKIGSGDPVIYTTMAGLRLTRLTLNADTIDTTNADSASEWRELLGGAGVKSANVSGQGVFKDSATDATLRTVFFSQSVNPYQVIIPDFGTIAGDFIISQLEYAGEYKGEVTFALSLASAGALSFTVI
ncbi:MAG TPA: phage major tail protein, TP901-1 family [Alphaproteobacteria bacterium]|nr:phage major tail protein, TP901-1 family [Alphaproteobacteria bacterium]HAJ48520.1 phage major tail protein, TP901-1 family [Alphaproteobacteria bacterium]